MVENFPVAAILAALAALVAGGAAEALHARRVRRIAPLAFGPRERPAAWARSAPVLRAAALAAVAFGLVTLLLIPPEKVSRAETAAGDSGEKKHVLLVLDVSPSMRLADAGPSGAQSRLQRARDVMESFFDRVPIETYRVSVVAVYNGAKPVVIDTKDFEVVRNILGDLPMEYAFPSGKTTLFAGIEEAARISKPWNPRSTTLVLVSDGDTVPASGMPRLPASIASVLVIGVGDPKVGKFIDGRHSRQDVSTLRQIAVRLGGSFHDGNEKHVATSLVSSAFDTGEGEPWVKLGLREYALIAALLGSLVLALLPFLLHYFGTGFRPGVPAERWRAESAAPDPVAGGRSSNPGPAGIIS